MSEDTDDPDTARRISEAGVLVQWPVRQWRMEAYTGNSRRGPGGMITADLVPPRH